MTIGDNQLNIHLLEVGYQRAQNGVVLPGMTFTTGIHPLLVAPTRIQYDDVSRTPIMQTVGGSLETSSGRALRTVSLDGTFGVEERGLGPYLGTGEIRFQRFYTEVVRMSDALFEADVQGLVNPFGFGSTALATVAGAVSGQTPGLPLLVSQFHEDDSTFYVNWYDFWNNISFQCQIKSFTFWREHRNGGATGLVHYRMTLQEVGPLVTGNLTSTIISALLQGLSFWSGVNEAITTYTLGNIVDSFSNLAAPFETLIAGTGTAIQAQEQGFQTFLDQMNTVQQLMSGKASTGVATPNGNPAIEGTSTATTTTTSTAKTTSSGASTQATLEAQQAIATFFDNANTFASAASELALDVASQIAPFDSETGQIDYSAQLAEGGSRELQKWDELTSLLDFEEAARWQPVAGVLFGMDRETYRAYIEAGGAGSQTAPEVAGTLPYSVADTDTQQSIEQQFNVSWDRILAANRLTPDEALYPGTVLHIPVLRTRGAPGIAGLPTFGSHIGQSAWGTDFLAAMDGDDSTGDFAVVSGTDVLEQGAEFIVDTFASQLLKRMEGVPDKVKSSFVQKQLARIFLTDERVQSVEEVVVESEDVNVDVQVRLRAINGTAVVALGG